MHWALRQFNNQLGSDTQVSVGQQNWQNFLSFFNCVPNPIVHTCMKWQQIDFLVTVSWSYIEMTTFQATPKEITSNGSLMLITWKSVHVMDKRVCIIFKFLENTLYNTCPCPISNGHRKSVWEPETVYMKRTWPLTKWDSLVKGKRLAWRNTNMWKSIRGELPSSMVEESVGWSNLREPLPTTFTSHWAPHMIWQAPPPHMISDHPAPSQPAQYQCSKLASAKEITVPCTHWGWSPGLPFQLLEFSIPARMTWRLFW